MSIIKTAAALVFLSMVAGCASVNMADPEASASAKGFVAPDEGMAGVYVFRKKQAGGSALKKDIWIDGECLGESARGVFFYRQVDGDREHEIATESEFSPNTTSLLTEAGRNYFVEQYIRMGVFVGGANLRVHDEESGMREVSKLEMAAGGRCSGTR